jgi:membrane protein implicated in regulation of membrane protease activity
VGLLLRGQALALPLALVAAVVGAFLLRSLMDAFIRSSSAPLSLSGEGAIATVNATIHPNSAGEVGYTLEGLHRSAIARSEDGIEIPRGTQVVITRRDGGIAWVEPIDPLDDLS